MVLESPWPWLIAQATAPSSVHGVCQLVLVIMSGQTTLRPAPHMPVNSWHGSQNPSRAATLSRIRKPQAGQTSTLLTRADTLRRRHKMPCLWRSSPVGLALAAFLPTASWPDSMVCAASTLWDIEGLPLAPSGPGSRRELSCQADAAPGHRHEVT